MPLSRAGDMRCLLLLLFEPGFLRLNLNGVADL